MADADQYRDWAAQQIDRQTRDAMCDEADRIDRREARHSTLEVRIVVER